MEWLLNLFSINVPDAELESWRLSLRGGIAWWLAGAIFVVALVGIVFFYARERAPVRSFRRYLMAGIRIAAVALVLILLMRPVLVTEYKGERPSGVALVLDNSQSMTLKDQRLSPEDRIRVAIAEGLVAPDFNTKDVSRLGSVPTKTTKDPQRADVVRAVLKNDRLNLVEGMEQFGPLKAYLIGQNLNSITLEAKPNTKLTDTILAAYLADEQQTAVADGINAMLERPDELPAAVVLMTDGRDNASRISLQEIARECARVKVPLFIYGVGSAEGGNLQLKDAHVPDTVFFEDTVTVRVRWRARGFKKGMAEITLRLGDKVVAQKEVPVKEGEELIDELSFTPKKEGQDKERKELTVSIKYKGEGKESFTADNDVKRFVRISDQKVKVLYIENAPRWEYKFLQAGLMRDRRVDARFILVQADTETLEKGGPYLATFPVTRQDLFEYDLIILGDVDADYLGNEHMTWLRDFVSEGGGLIHIAGRHHGPTSYDNTPLAEVLPIEFLPVKFQMDIDHRPQPFSPELTKAGERSDMLTLADTPEDNEKVWKDLPGMYWHYPISKLRPGAVPLLVHPRRKMEGDKPMPLMASHYYGRGQVIFLAMDEVWRWRSRGEAKYPGRFWGQVIYHMGLPRLMGNLEQVQLALERSQNLVDRPSYLYARLFDTDFRPVKDKSVLAQLEQLDAPEGTKRLQPVKMVPVPGQPGEFRALLPNNKPGRFRIKIDHPEPANMEYRVDLPPRHELEVAGMAEESLREAARLSGGKYYREEDLHRMTKEIPERKNPFIHRQEILLWNLPMLVIFVVLLTTEWVIRKFSNLS